MKIALNYTIFALIASIINILSQDISINLYDGSYSITVSILFGTITGLLTKYILDKKYIFKYKTVDHTHNGRILILYTSMGIATTIVFWSFELLFYYIYGTKEMRYIGGLIGLGIGYYIKYHLDKKYVFIERDKT